jgi:acyl-CoA ligase (AMP-forming) (exosortase A-associated)
MPYLVPDLLAHSAARWPDRTAVSFRGERRTYGEVQDEVGRLARCLVGLGLHRNDRVGIYLAKQFETVSALFAAARAGTVYVPVNPVLKPRQVAYILKDCNVRVLITSGDRLAPLADALADCPDLHALVVVNPQGGLPRIDGLQVLSWDDAVGAPGHNRPLRTSIDADMAAILYTSGSTGMPKGVVLSHRNIVAGAKSVAQYLGNVPEDRILAVPPFSFDYGMNQLMTSMLVGAECVLFNYLMPRDVIAAVARERVTGLPCVPPVWIELARLDWPKEASGSLRYWTSTGGRMPVPVIKALREKLPATTPYVMYGLTEAFRSTYVPPEELDRRPDSIGKAIPNAEIVVARENGELAAPNEPGELVHRGVLVAMGYWNDPERTAERFRPAPARPGGIVVPEIAVWSGDTVRMDEEGFLYFIGRRDEMIKSLGYRISPTEVEEAIYASGLVAEAAAVGVPHAELGQAVVVLAAPRDGETLDGEAVIAFCRRELPGYMTPQAVLTREALPRNPNGKIDRKALALEAADLFKEWAG